MTRKIENSQMSIMVYLIRKKIENWIHFTNFLFFILWLENWTDKHSLDHLDHASFRSVRLMRREHNSSLYIQNSLKHFCWIRMESVQQVSPTLCSVLFDELSSLGGLPQKMSVVVGVVFSPALSGQHSGNRSPASTKTAENRFNTRNKKYNHRAKLKPNRRQKD